MRRVLPADRRTRPARLHAVASAAVLADHRGRGHSSRRGPWLGLLRAGAPPGAPGHSGRPRRVQAAFESQQRFIANASHELRTPLAVMHATVDVVLGNPDATPDDLRGMASDIGAAVDHAENLIGALLMLARNERGLTVREETDLATAAEDVLDTAALGDRRVHATLEAAV